MLSIIQDIQKFMWMFGYVISSSTPHLYLSALVFAPEHSWISQHQRSRFSNSAMLCGGQSENWPVLESVMQGHDEVVTSVTFSPDGKHIVSGSGDKTV
jgi:WD40 repeat protein